MKKMTSKKIVECWITMVNRIPDDEWTFRMSPHCGSIVPQQEAIELVRELEMMSFTSPFDVFI
jgi:hypothetical protein